MSTLEQRAQQAMESGEVVKTFCDTKQEVLDLIKDDKADAMSVSRPPIMFETPRLTHYAVRFNDRKLGEEVRTYTMRGFGIS